MLKVPLMDYTNPLYHWDFSTRWVEKESEIGLFLDLALCLILHGRVFVMGLRYLLCKYQNKACLFHTRDIVSSLLICFVFFFHYYSHVIHAKTYARISVLMLQ